MTARLEPCSQQTDVRGSAHAVSAFNHDQLAAVFCLFDAGERRSVSVLVINEIVLASCY